MKTPSTAGKGDRPRNCFSKQFKDNFDLIKWKSKEKPPEDNISKTTDDTNKKHSV